MKLITVGVRSLQWFYEYTLNWIIVRPEAPLVFTAHMMSRSMLAVLRHWKLA